MTAALPVSTYELPRGTRLGKYEIVRRIETGGMAEIYLAKMRGTAGFEKLVVLKRILPNVAEDPTFVNMFLDEARLAATLQHPNIADVYDVGEIDGTYFFTMEFIYGQDLRAIRGESRKGEQAVPMSVALAIVHGVASALDYAHERQGPDGKLLGLVHRDVSPSNILVSYDGAVKLVDFGIAHAASAQHKTQTGTLKGKIPYMSPEQTRGLPLDRRSDLFSLGIVLYELTVGRRPFRGESDFDLMDQIVNVGAAPPRTVVPSYPEDLEQIVMRLLQRAPSLRYTTGDELIHELDDVITKHQLWVSPKALGKYMRELFRDKIEAWEEAERLGVPFEQHVVQSITSQSQRSELVTPPSAYPGLPPRTSSQIFSAQPDPTLALQPSNSRLIWIIAASLALAAGGIVGYMVHERNRAAAAKLPPVAEQRVQMTPSVAPEPAPTAVPTAVPAAAPVPEPEPLPEPQQTVRTPSPQPPPPAPTPTHKRVTKPKPQSPTKDTTTKDTTWDPNSPFLPQ